MLFEASEKFIGIFSLKRISHVKIVEKCFISLRHSLFLFLGVLSFSLLLLLLLLLLLPSVEKQARLVARYPINSLCVWWERSTITFAFVTLDSRSIPVLPRSSFSFAAGARHSLSSPAPLKLISLLFSLPGETWLFGSSDLIRGTSPLLVANRANNRYRVGVVKEKKKGEAGGSTDVHVRIAIKETYRIGNVVITTTRQRQRLGDSRGTAGSDR